MDKLRHLNRHGRRRLFKILGVAAIAALLGMSEAEAQSTPGLQFGQVPTAAQWNSYFAQKLDYPVALSTCTYLTWTQGLGFGCNTAPTPSATTLATTDVTTNATVYPTFTTNLN